MMAIGTLYALPTFAQTVPNPHSKEEIGTVQQVYDGVLLPDVQANTFRNIDRLFATRAVKHDPAHVYPLPQSDKKLTQIEVKAHDKTYDLVDYITINRVAGLLVLKDGKIAYETYQLGN